MRAWWSRGQGRESPGGRNRGRGEKVPCCCGGRGHRPTPWARHAGQGHRGRVSKQLVRPVSLREGILGSQESLRCRAMPLALGILLEGIGDGYSPVAQVLPVHCLYSSIRRFETCIVDKCKALGVSGFRIPLYLWRGENDPEGRKSVVQQFLVHLGIQVPDENICPHVQVLLVRRGLVDPDWLPEQLDHVHDLDRVVCVILRQELHKAVALMHHRDSVLGHVYVDHWPGLYKQLP